MRMKQAYTRYAHGRKLKRIDHCGDLSANGREHWDVMSPDKSRSEHFAWRQASSSALAAIPLCRDSQSKRFSSMRCSYCWVFTYHFYVIDIIHILTINISSHRCTLWYTMYGIYQLLHISAPRCYPQEVTITDVQYISQNDSLVSPPHYRNE
jgi:hypothetical protein